MTTPNELAAELRISPKTLRAFLRQAYPDRAPGKGRRWALTPGMIWRARGRFA